MYAMVKGELIEIMGAILARSNWIETMGVDKNVLQIEEKDTGVTISIFNIIDREKWDSGSSNFSFIALDNIEQINKIIEENNFDVYSKDNESIMTANLNYLVTQGVIDFNDLSVEMTEQQELKYLYDKGCSGISKSRRYKLLPTE